MPSDNHSPAVPAVELAADPSLDGHGDMCWSICLSPDGDYVHVETHGTFSPVDFQALVRAVVSRPFWRPGNPFLVDHRDLNMRDARFADMLVAGGVHRHYDQQIGPASAAIVLRDMADFGTAQMYDGVTRSHIQAKLRYFTDFDEARTWIEQQARVRDDDPLPPDVHGHFAV